MALLSFLLCDLFFMPPEAVYFETSEGDTEADFFDFIIISSKFFDVLALRLSSSVLTGGCTELSSQSFISLSSCF